MSSEAARPSQEGNDDDISNHTTNHLEGQVNRTDTATPTETIEQPAAPERRTTTTPTRTPTDGTTRTRHGVVRNHTEQPPQRQDASLGGGGGNTNEIRVRRGQNVSIRVQLDGSGNRRFVVQTPDGRTIVPTVRRVPPMATGTNRPDTNVQPNNNNNNNNNHAQHAVGGGGVQPAQATPTAGSVSNNPLPTPQRTTTASSSASVNPNQTATNNTNGVNQQATGTTTTTTTTTAEERHRQRLLRAGFPVRLGARPTPPNVASPRPPIRLANVLPPNHPMRRNAAAATTAANNTPFVTIGTPNHHRPPTASIRLPPLTAQPLPYQSLRQRQTPEQQPTNDDDDGGGGGNGNTSNTIESQLNRAQQERYKCPICFEFLRVPSSCGSCSSRFCFPCLQRVCSSAPANTEPRCPTCRSSLDPEEIVRDTALQQEILHALNQTRVTCCYQGCRHECSPLQMSAHEANCGYCRLRCKYSSMGCSWTGLRKDLAHHEANGCAYAPIHNLVEQFRTLRAEQQHQVLHLQHRNAGTTGMMEIQTRLIRALYLKPNNPLDILSCVYTAVCTPTSFLVLGDRFQFFQPLEARGLVTNLLFLLPFLVQTIRVANTGYRVLLNLDAYTDDSQNWLYAIDQVLLSIAATLMACLAATLLVLDLRSSLTWTKYRVPRFGELEVVRYATTILLWSYCIMVVEFDGITILSAVLWLWTCVSSCCFGSIVTTVLTVCRNGSDNNSPTPQDILTMSRVPSVVCIGLCYGVVTGLVGALPVLDAVVLLRFLCTTRLPSLTPLYLINQDLVDFFIGRQAFGVRVAVQAVLMLHDDGRFLQSWAVQVVMAFCLLVLTGWLVHGCLYLGTRVGVKIVNMARPLALQQQQQHHHPVMDVNYLGLLCTVTWITLLGAIALS